MAPQASHHSFPIHKGCSVEQLHHIPHWNRSRACTGMVRAQQTQTSTSPACGSTEGCCKQTELQPLITDAGRTPTESSLSVHLAPGGAERCSPPCAAPAQAVLPWGGHGRCLQAPGGGTLPGTAPTVVLFHLPWGPKIFGSMSSGWAGLLIFWSPKLGVTPTFVFIFALDIFSGPIID